MEARTSKTLVMFWLAVTCIAAAVAAEESASESASASVVPFGSAEETQDLASCILIFKSVEVCIEAIHKAVSDKKFGEVEHACCQAITLVGDNCWPIIFPNQPLVPLLLSTICKILGTVGKGAQAPSQ